MHPQLSPSAMVAPCEAAGPPKRAARTRSAISNASVQVCSGDPPSIRKAQMLPRKESCDRVPRAVRAPTKASSYPPDYNQSRPTLRLYGKPRCQLWLLSAYCCDEPVSVRILRRPDQAVYVLRLHSDEISKAYLGAAAGPDRSPRGSAAGGLPEVES